MKMEHALLAPADGTVSEISAQVGAQIAEGARILTIESASS
jgi:3-methylcrotonyl-CoA carboxylase alpha subunit